MIAATRAGFILHPPRTLYQPPIKAYATTFHAIFAGDFVGDFILTFYKPVDITVNEASATVDLNSFKECIDDLIKNHVDEKISGLPIISGRELIKYLMKKGFIISRQRGSHMVLKSQDSRRVTVPLHEELDEIIEQIGKE